MSKWQIHFIWVGLIRIRKAWCPILGVTCVASMLSSCQSIPKLGVETTGTDRLIQVLESENEMGKKSVATELGVRLLTDSQIHRLLVLVESPNAPRVRIQVLKSLALVLNQRKSELLNRDVRNFLLSEIPKISDDKVCYEAFLLAKDLTEETDVILEHAIHYIKNNRHALVRYWALCYAIEHGFESTIRTHNTLDSIHEVLRGNEKNAAVAELACRQLGEHKYEPALEILKTISNSGDVRKYKSANYDNNGRKWHRDVLIAAIRAAEKIQFKDLIMHDPSFDKGDDVIDEDVGFPILLQ